MQASARSLQHDATDPSSPQQQGLPTGPRGLPKQRPALAQLREAMTALHIGRLCRAVSYELFTYWSPGGTVFPSVKALADGMGLKRRSVRHHLAHLERVGLWVRIGREDETNLYVLHLPGEAQEGFVKPEPRPVAADPPARTCRTPGTQMPPEVIKEVPKEVISASSRARVVCPDCGNSWPNKAEYGIECFKCSKKPKASTRTTTDELPQRPEPKACVCGESYNNAYRGKCLDCKGEPSAAQRDALREKQGGGVTHDRGLDHGGGAGTTSVPETETRQPPETRGESSEDSVLPEHAIPPDGGEPGPNEQQFYQDMAKWRLKKGATHDGQTDDRTDATSLDGTEAQGRRADGPGRG